MTARRTTTLLASAAIVAGALALAPTTAGGQTAGCDQPYAPVAFAELYPAQEALPPVDGNDVSLLLQRNPTFDSDGDGVIDLRDEEPGGGLRIVRGDGDVVLSEPGDGVDAYGLGDLDGDGRDEFVVQVRDGTPGTSYVVPGTVPTGTMLLADAAIRMPNGTAGLTPVPDGSGRLLDQIEPTNSVTDARTDIFDDATVLALGPGGDAGTLVPDLSVAGRALTFGDIGEPMLVLVTGRLVGPVDDTTIELVVVRGTDVVVLTSAPEPYFPEYVEPIGRTEVVDGADGTFVRVDQTSRSGAASYLWSLDDPCTPLVVAAPTTTTTTPTATPATPAAPIAAEARFTG
jgi:hypothetical protein